MDQLIGKKAVITGGAGGIGLAVAKSLLSEGCDITIWDKDVDGLSELKTGLQGKERNIFIYECDVSDPQKVSVMTEKAIEDMGRIDILINNAGTESHGRFCDVPIETWEALTRTNLMSVYYTTHAILPHMHKQNSGHIVNLSDAAAFIGVADLAVYGATKSGIWSFTESLRVEAKMDKKNISFTSVHPHFIKKGMFAGGRLSFLGEIFVPGIKDHDVVAKAIVEKALKKNHNVVKIPVTLHLPVFLRGILPDSVLFLLATTLFGVGSVMKKWTGYGTDS